MNALFRGGRTFKVATSDFRNFENLEAKEVVVVDDNGVMTRYQIPVGALSDIASTPPITWGPPADLPPFGPYAADAYWHDSAYRNTLLKWDGENWVPANLTKDQCDEIFRALMFSGGTAEAKRDAIYEGVHLGGWKAFRDDRAPAP